MNTADNKLRSLKQKLLDIQKENLTFAIEDESEKKNTDGKPAYRYTPGWKIVERIRKSLDERGIMLTLTNVSLTNDVITYPVYKENARHEIVRLEKTEVLTTIRGEYTFEDVDTGETAGPYAYAATGANGTDKSCASAYSLLERYFLLKHFHITTREASDEPDAHDSDTVPGVENLRAPSFNGGYAQQAGQPYPGQAGFPVQVQPVAPSFFPQPQAYGQGFPQGYPQPLAQGYPQPSYPAQQQNIGMPGKSIKAQMADKYGNNADVLKVIDDLSNFEKSTPLALQTLNDSLQKLRNIGYTCTSDENFIGYLTETAQAKRERRAPVYA